MALLRGTLMEQATARAPRSAPVAFEDGLGERRYTVGAANEPLEVLTLRDELTSVSSFEFALRERVSRLASFQHECYGRVHGVERLDQGQSGLAVVSDHVSGVRLSEILAVAEKHLLPLEINAAIYLIRQLVPAIAALHQAMPDACHGAIAPERMVITPDGRLVVVEHVLGSALEQLRFSHERYWKELRIPLPRTVGLPRFDRRGDITQVGAVALALILGRPLGDDEFPARIGEIAGAAWALTATGGIEPLPAAVRMWLSRTLQLDPRSSFASAVEANAELTNVLAANDDAASAEALDSFLKQYYACVAADAVPIEPIVMPRVSTVPAISAASSLVTPQSSSPAAAASTVLPPPPVAKPRPAIVEPALPAIAPLATAPPPSVSAVPAAPPAVTPTVAIPIAVSPLAAAVAGGAPVAVTASTVASSVVPPAPPARPKVQAPPLAPKPASVATPAPLKPHAVPAQTPPVVMKVEAVHKQPDSVPDVSHPVMPKTLESFPKRKDSEHGGASESAAKAPSSKRRLIAIAAGALIVLASGGTLATRFFMAPSAAAATAGTLAVNTNPSGIAVVIDGQLRGATPVNLTLAAGQHTLELVTDEGRRSIPISIAAGGQVSQFIELPKAAAVSGQLQVRTEPSGARVTVDGRPVGRAPLTVDGLTPGPHTVVLENDLGSITENVKIEAGTTASLVVPLTGPQGVPVSGWIAVNAPVDVQIFEGQRLLGSSRSDRIMVSVGRHELDVMNESLGYRATRVVQVAPGQVSAVKLDWPKGSMALNALPWAEVWIDGERVGETPIGNVSVPIGQHEVVFRHPELGEKAATATVSLNGPARLSVDLRKK